MIGGIRAARAASIAFICAVAGLAAGGAASAQAQPPRVLSPGANAVIAGSPVRVVVLRPPGAKLTIDLGRRNVTRRFRADGRVLVGKLAARDGLRRGLNIVSVTAARTGKPPQTEAGRYARLERRFVIARTAPLPDAGLDRFGRPGMHIRLGGLALAAHGGALHYRWVLTVKPNGSRARLVGATRASAMLIPDQPGHYGARQYVTERPGPDVAVTGSAETAANNVSVTVTPRSELLKLRANAEAYDPRGIQAGGTFYHNEGPGASFQWLTLDRATLQPTQTGNSWCCGTGHNSLGYLRRQLTCGSGSSLGLGQLVIITVPSNQATISSSQFDEFNDALQALGVDPLPDSDLNGAQQSETIVGIPCAGAGTGWVKQRPIGGGGLPTVGWLMPDGSTDSSGALRMRFQPERLLYDTSSESTATTNQMTFNGKTANGVLKPDEYVNGVPQPQIFGGFQVVEIDPRDLSIVDNQSFRTNTSSPGVNAAAIHDMASYLDAIGAQKDYIAIQSIGSVHPDDPSWFRLNDALDAFGVNPDIFNRINGSYAFFGGPPLPRSEVVQSSSVNVTDPTTSPPTHEPGKLRGRARINHDGYFTPVVSEPSKAGGSLYDDIFSPSVSKPWPYTCATCDPTNPTARVNVGDYSAALAYITSQVLPSWSPDLRQAYVGLPNQTWADLSISLENLRYPGDGTVCTQNPQKQTSNPGYTRAEFCNLTSELQHEFAALDNVKDLVGAYQKALSRSAGQQGNDLYDAGRSIKRSLRTLPNVDLAAPILYLIQAISDAGVTIFGGPAGLPLVLGLAASMTDLGVTAATENGNPVADKVSTKVDQLAAKIGSNVADAANGLDGVRAVANSNYGRLMALSKVETTQGGKWVSSISNQLTISADAYFSSTLLPLAYNVWWLPENARADKCIPFGYVKPPWRGLPASTWTEFVYDYFGDTPPDFHSLVFNQKGQNAGYYPGYPPDPKHPALTDAMFRPISQGGYGINKSTFFWAHESNRVVENCYFGG